MHLYKSLIPPNGDKLQEIINLDQGTMDLPWSNTAWETLSDNNALYIYEDKKQCIVGFILFNLVDRTGHILKIAVSSANQRSGIGSKILDFAKNDLRREVCELYLEVEASNTNAIEFYNKHGFTELHRTQNYYSNGEAAIFMQLVL